MKNSKKLLITCLFLLSGCTITKGMWEPRIYDENFKNYFIDEKVNRVVLIGENNLACNGKEGFNYSIDIKEKNLEDVFKFGEKKPLELSFEFAEVEGSNLITPLWLGFDKKNLSSEEIKVLQSRFKVGTKVGFRYEKVLIERYPSSKESNINPKLISVLNKNQMITEKNTPIQTTGKILLTPFTLAADILLIPITIPLFIYQQIKESQI